MRIWSPCDRCSRTDGPLRAVPCRECRAAIHRVARHLLRDSMGLIQDAARLRDRARRRIQHSEELLRQLGRRSPGPSASSPALAGLRVLVVEDDQPIRDALRLLLLDEGAAVMEAGDGLEALQVLERDPVDIVICDLRMPRLDGRALVERLRADQRLARTPVVAVSAVTVGRQALAGFDAYLPKPFDAHALLETLDRLRDRRAA